MTIQMTLSLTSVACGTYCFRCHHQLACYSVWGLGRSTWLSAWMCQALYIAERVAREEVATRSSMAKLRAQKKKEHKEVTSIGGLARIVSCVAKLSWSLQGFQNRSLPSHNTLKSPTVEKDQRNLPLGKARIGSQQHSHTRCQNITNEACEHHELPCSLCNASLVHA